MKNFFEMFIADMKLPRFPTDQIRSNSFSVLITFSINSAAMNMEPSVVCFSCLYLLVFCWLAGTRWSCVLCSFPFVVVPIYFYSEMRKAWSSNMYHSYHLISGIYEIIRHSFQWVLAFSIFEIDAIKKSVSDKKHKFNLLRLVFLAGRMRKQNTKKKRIFRRVWVVAEESRVSTNFIFIGGISCTNERIAYQKRRETSLWIFHFSFLVRLICVNLRLSFYHSRAKS